MTQIDKSALDVATEELRPLFREPVSYLESAAEKAITAYLASLPPPTGEVGQLTIAEANAIIDKNIAKAAAIPALPAPTGEVGACSELLDDLRAGVICTGSCETDDGEVEYFDIEDAEDKIARAADALTALSARLAECERERDEINNARRILNIDGSRLQDDLASATARAERLEAALTPSAETKCAYSGEFKISFPDTQFDEDEEEYVEVHREIIVPWTSVKQIMKAIKARAALSAAPTPAPEAGMVLVPREPTEAMLEAALDDQGDRCKPYVAPRECGVPIDCDISAEDAEIINGEIKQGYANIYRAMIAAAAPALTPEPRE